MVKWHNQHGAAAFSEYVVTFFLVVGFIVTMTTYMQRTLQARVHDARTYMINAVSRECGVNCMNATGLSSTSYTIGEQYEPYYTQINATTNTDSLSHKGLLATGIGGTGTFIARTNQKNQGNIGTSQLPPKDVSGDKVLGRAMK
ncbi:MAG: hypothetical protein WCH62_06055 [Candidatus Omnitrophota bacterium]